MECCYKGPLLLHLVLPGKQVQQEVEAVQAPQASRARTAQVVVCMAVVRAACRVH